MSQVDTYPILALPATISDYILVIDASTPAGFAKIMFDGDDEKFLNGEGELISIPISSITGL